jgi:hypothetical protein
LDGGSRASFSFESTSWKALIVKKALYTASGKTLGAPKQVPPQQLFFRAYSDIITRCVTFRGKPQNEFEQIILDLWNEDTSPWGLKLRKAEKAHD